MSINNTTRFDWDKVTTMLNNKNQESYVDPLLKTYTDAAKEEQDAVNSPRHYNANGNIECIDSIEASMSVEQFKGYCKGNAQKYIWRMSYKKNAIEDLRKARWYLDRLIDAEMKTPTDI